MREWLAEVAFLTGLILVCISGGVFITIRFLDRLGRWTYRDN